MKLRLLDEAKEEIRQASLWYEERQEGLGDDFLAGVQAALEAIEANPSQFAELEKYRGPRNVRRYLLQRFPYLVVFEILAEEALVLAVAHGGRRPNYWKNRGP